MRSDYVLYIIGAILFMMASYALFNVESLEAPTGGRLLFGAIVFVLALFGVTAFIFGYSARPKKRKLPFITPSPTVESITKLTRVKGIGEKRAEQLKALGISTVADLSAASAEELAEQLQISSKITNQWVKNARNLLLEK